MFVFISLFSVRPRQPGERRLLRLSHFHCAFCTPPPPSAQGGGGRSVPKNPREHRWASGMLSFYNEFSVESGSLRAASPGLLVRDTFYTLQECSSLLPAQLNLPSTGGSKAMHSGGGDLSPPDHLYFRRRELF